MVHSYGAPIKTRDCPPQIEPIFQEHLLERDGLFSRSISAEKRLETFSQERWVGGKSILSSPPSAQCPSSPEEEEDVRGAGDPV